MITPILQKTGTDAEFFLRDKNSGEIVSAEGFVKGTKYRPFRFDKEASPWYTTQLDNVLAEITIPPASCFEEFFKAITKAREYIHSTIPENLETVALASAILDEKYLQTDQARAFGCEPDFNAYTKGINEKPFCENFQLRSCGGHIHTGFDGIEVKFRGDVYNYEVDEQRASIVRMLDLHVSVPLVIMEPDSERKLLYGKAGAFRPKPYGLEYRSPSNWYLNDESTVKWAFESVQNAFKYLGSKGVLADDLATHVEKVINTNNKSEASSLVKDFNLQLA